MFPQTDNIPKGVDMSLFLFGNTDDHYDIYRISSRGVETCVLLVKESISDDDMVSIKVDLEGISLDQGKYDPPEKPTYGNIRKWVKEKYGFSVSTLYIAQVKGKAGIKERQNYNIGTGKGKELSCPPEKEAAIMEAFRHFRLI